MRAVDPEAADLEALRRRAKRQLRERAKASRAAIPPAAREMRSSRVAERLLTLAELDAARAIALFGPWKLEAKWTFEVRTTASEAQKKMSFIRSCPVPAGPSRGLRE